MGTRSYGKTQESSADLAFLAKLLHHKHYSDNMSYNTQDYVLVVSKQLLDYACFADKQQLDILLRTSQSV
jgi:hypothetical protein